MELKATVLNYYHKKPRLLGAKAHSSFHLQMYWITSKIISASQSVNHKINIILNCIRFESGLTTTP